MFSSNDKISPRQIKRLLVFELFGAASLLLPPCLAKSGNGIGIWSILAATAFAVLYLCLMQICVSRMVSDYLDYLKSGWGSFLSRLLYLCYALLSLFTCAWASKVLSELVCDSLLDRREFAAALLVILVLAYYGASAGIEARARVYEILFWVLVLPLLIMLLLCVRQVQVMQWFPLLGSSDAISWSWFWSGTWQCFAAFLPLTFLLFLTPHTGDRSKSARASVCAVLLSGLSLAVIYLILLGIFGSGALAKEEYPVITLMGMVKIPGDFLKRLDAVMVGGWFFTLYALIGTTLFYGVVIARRALTSWQAGGAKDEEGRKERRSANIWFFAAAVISYGLAYLFHLWPQVQVLAAKVFYLAGVPFVVIVPVLSLLLCKAPLQEDVVKKV
ncbi:MAG: spore germination protein [Eubacterium sp.]|nr:spore germination protein [Eubacterium sp.]